MRIARHLYIVRHAQRGGGPLEEPQHQRRVRHAQLVGGRRHALQHVRQEQAERAAGLAHAGEGNLREYRPEILFSRTKNLNYFSREERLPREPFKRDTAYLARAN